MPNQLSEDKRRVTYTEWKDVHEVLKETAKRERLDVSDIVRRATLAYIQELQKTRKTR
jgi:hypothetical protein